MICCNQKISKSYSKLQLITQVTLTQTVNTYDLVLLKSNETDKYSQLISTFPLSLPVLIT